MLGENYVQKYEYNKLCKLNKKDLAEKIEMHCHNNEYPGYDITSFDDKGNKIFIEVKSTKGKSINAFVMTDNEWQAAEKEGNNYFIYLVNNIGKGEPKILGQICDPATKWKNKKLIREVASYDIKIS